MQQDVSSRWTGAGWSSLLSREFRRRLSIRAKITLHQVVVALTLLASGVATWFGVERIDYYFDRNRLAQEQLETVLRLSSHLNRYSENVAELLLLGRTELDDFLAARQSVEEVLDELSQLTDQEVDFVRSEEERAEEAGEQERIRHVRSLFEEIDLATQRLLFLRDQGQQERAVALFRDAIEEGFSAELDGEIAAALADEEAELRQLQMRTNRLEGQIIAFVLSVILGAILVSALAGARLAGALTRPIQDLIAATRAIGSGDLGHRIGDSHPEEFAALARQFNRTAGQLEAQQREVRDRQAGLEGIISQRTAELEEANERLQRLDRMRVLFLADISHELRTPLTVLRGEAEVALRGTRTIEEHRETLGRVVQLAQQMGRLVEDLLFLGRAEVGAVRFEMQPLVLQEVIEIALADAEILAEERGLGLDARLPETILRVEGDAGRLTQAVLIVLDNAVKYSSPGGRIDIELDRSGPEARLRVGNRGPGIPKADLPFVFNRFYRGRTERGVTEGSGLGLPIAKWIVDAHGGAIDIASAEERTVVTFRLPLAP
ncbi:sensor histidine kinase [Rubellimicrobium roseum]|uniref:histidine kinase n=1 Tax=Rubellimicrobium roseum TaxID=687525 RepID=A0A5C4N3P9_9RHOB|nr:ATP-binding protein [Rubellimicrobium roseum]TNC60898.1 HAMP domain-containing protein [Rubellimicrobium roseum]